jgi:hypothetical protein
MVFSGVGRATDHSRTVARYYRERDPRGMARPVTISDNQLKIGSNFGRMESQLGGNIGKMA